MPKNRPFLTLEEVRAHMRLTVPDAERFHDAGSEVVIALDKLREQRDALLETVAGLTVQRDEARAAFLGRLRRRRATA